MGTLVLSSAGAVLAGPLGSAIGGYVGREIDRSFAGGAHRPISDLRLQSSSYGTTIPAIYGRMRVAGAVIWASELVQTALVGKSGAQHAYSVSFAIAVSCRAIASVHRIWADGRLIRGAEGDHKIPFTLRIQHGHEDQPLDSLITSAEGMAATPAFRGTALLVFEDFDLSTFGNRLPQITAEVDAGDASLDADELTGELLKIGVVNAAHGRPLAGFATPGETTRDAVEPLVTTFRQRFSLQSGTWRVGAMPDRHVIQAREIGEVAGAAKKTELRTQVDLGGAGMVSVRYFDEALDYGASEQTARYPEARQASTVEFPGVLDGSHAKAIAQEHLAEAGNGGECLRIALPLSRATITLGDRIVLADRAEEYQVRRKRIAQGRVELTLSLLARNIAPLPATEARRTGEADRVGTPLRVAVVDLPVSPSGIGIIVAGGVSPWRPVPVKVSVGDVTSEMLSSRLPGTIGAISNAVEPAADEVFDLRNIIEVGLEEGAWLESCEERALLAGANLAQIGSELIQFRVAEPIGAGRFRLRELIRGRYGTKAHRRWEAGTPFVLLEPASMVSIPVAAEFTGAEVRVEAFAFDGQVCTIQGAYAGLAHRPLSPVHARWTFDGSNLHVSWVRRSRVGQAWADHVDAPFDAAIERYRVSLFGQAGQRLELAALRPSLSLAETELASLGPRPWRLEICQVGDFGLSPALVQNIT